MALICGFALRPTDNSTDFSDAIYAVVGNGITLQGGRFGLTINGFTATLSSGYAFAAGRWVENDVPLELSIGPSGNNDDRTDVLVARVDCAGRKASLEILADVDPAAIRASPGLLRDDEQYCVPLYFIQVRRGVTSLTPNDATDLREDRGLCGRVVPLSAIAGDVLYIYQFLVSGIDGEVARLVGLSERAAQKADTAIIELDKAIQQAGGRPGLGELMTARNHPAPTEEWLLCAGGRVPPEYPALSGLLGGTLPNIAGDRYKTYIFGGTPAEV